MSETRGQNLQSYANTPVPPSRTKEQIEDLLLRVGAEGFRWSSRIDESEQLEAGLLWQGRRISFRLKVTFADERERKRRLRALYWYLKAKIEAIQFGIVDMEQEFLPYLLTASGRTVFDDMALAEKKSWLLEAPKDNE